MITDLIEMWGYFMGREYAHRRYGPNKHSLSISPTFDNSWYSLNENRALYPNNASVFEFGHIPAGFLHDIIDNNSYNNLYFLNEHPIIQIDSISGYSISNIYSNLDGNTKSPTTLMDKLFYILPVVIQGNTNSNYSILRSYYNY